jgi:predicted DNA binding protein
MYIITLDMEQYDCPFINTSDDLEVSYYMTYWDFKDSKLINRGYIFASSDDELQNSLEALSRQPKFLELGLLERNKNTALVRTTIDFTDAMSIVRKNNGYIVGPFFVRNGKEVWHIGFDRREDLENALSELSNKNNFVILKENNLTIADFSKVIEILPNLVKFVSSLEKFTFEERLIIEAALKYGFLDDPRNINLEGLAKNLYISKGTLSKKFRKVAKRIFQETYELLKNL